MKKNILHVDQNLKDYNKKYYNLHKDRYKLYYGLNKDRLCEYQRNSYKQRKIKNIKHSNAHLLIVEFKL